MTIPTRKQFHRPGGKLLIAPTGLAQADVIRLLARFSAAVLRMMIHPDVIAVLPECQTSAGDDMPPGLTDVTLLSQLIIDRDLATADVAEVLSAAMSLESAFRSVANDRMAAEDRGDGCP